MYTVLRISRHPLDSDREAALKAAYGVDIEIVTQDIRYGDDPVAAVQALIARVEADGGKVFAIEAQAPFSVMMELIAVHRQLGVDLLRATFVRDEDGRMVVTGQDAAGRDTFEFEGYELLERIVFETRPLKSRE